MFYSIEKGFAAYKKDEPLARLFRGAADRICKERSDGTAIVRRRRNRVTSSKQSLFARCFKKRLRLTSCFSSSRKSFLFREPFGLLFVVKKDEPLARLFLVLLAGFEPARYHYRGILSPLRLPVSPQQHSVIYYIIIRPRCQQKIIH